MLKEFYLEIQPMSLVKGQGLSKMIVDRQVGDENEFKFDNGKDDNKKKKMIISQVDIGQGVVIDVWYQDIVYYLLEN